MKRHVWIWIGVGALLLPFLLNIFIGLRAPQNIDIVGTPADWLQFHGDYISGVLGAIIAFLAINQSILSSRIERKEEFIKRLEWELGERVSLFDYSRIGIVSLYMGDKVKYNDVLKEMDDYSHKIATTSNAWGVVYADSLQTEVRTFQDAYVDCRDVMNARLTQVMRLVWEIKEWDEKKEKAKIAQSQKGVASCKAKIEQRQVAIKAITEQHNEYKRDYLNPLFARAQEWIRVEKKELEELKKKRIGY